MYFIGLSYRKASKKASSSRIRKEQVTSQSVNGWRNTNLKEYLLKEKGLLSL
jgi:hypothetical protein